MNVVEFGLMGVKPSHSIMDPTTKEGQVLKKAWDAVTAAQGGPYWAFGGVETDDTSRLWGFFEFDSLAHHEEFAKTLGAEAIKDLPSILTHSEFQKHVEVESDLRPVLQAPVTEVILTYFPSSITATEKSAISTQVQRIITSGLASCADARAASFGWSIENDFPVLGRGEGEGAVGSVLAVFVGWEKVDAANEFWDSVDHKKRF